MSVHRYRVLFAVVPVFGLVNLASAEVPHAFFRQHCVRCHGPETQEAQLRFDRLPAAGADAQTAGLWASIAAQIRNRDMPPQGEPRPASREVREVLDWIAVGLSQSSERLPALRRMNRIEYENTVHDLLGIDVPLAELLPEDNSIQGFDNVAGGLSLSSILMERYLEAADTAFAATIRRIKPLPPEARRTVLVEQKDNVSSIEQNKGGVIASEGAFIDFTPGWPPARIDPAHPIEDGIYRCRVAVWPYHPGDRRTLAVAIYAGPLFGAGKRRFMGMYDVTGTPEEPRIIEFTTRLAEAHTLHILPWIYPEHVTWRDKEEPRPGVGIVWAETYGPLDQEFPSRSQTRLFGDSPTISLVPDKPIYMRHRRGVKLHVVESAEPRVDAERVIRALVPRAFRRPVEDQLVDQFVALTLGRLDQGNSFEQAIQAGVTAVLCSPHFLLLNQSPVVDDYTIASRLSYFLWSSMPDEELMRLAEEGRLSDPEIRHQQIERMLKDDRSNRFVDNFTGQWLGLREIEFTTPDQKLYPEYDELLLRSMQAETRGFFRHVLDENLSVLNFIDSDFTILNQRLAEHYGIPGVRGHEAFRVVQIPENNVRGGILTHASVLKITANGTSTSPVMRGSWVLEHLLGQPAPPPPAGVPAVEPDIRGATTIREQLDRHRADVSCARCHARIDPPGFALEQFDVIGGERSWYRSLGDQGERVPKVNYRVGLPVEPDGQMADGRAFQNFREFRQLLLEDTEPVARAIAAKLLVYGCGRPVTAADDAIVTSVVNSAAARGHGLKDYIHAVVDSQLFLTP